jgi:hypothetical protein
MPKMNCRVIPALVLFAGASLAFADPATDYLLHCRGCHLPDGSSVPPEVPSLRDEIGRIVTTPAGRDYVIRVPGVAQSSLADKELAAVLNWVLTEFNADTLPAGFKPFGTKEVSAARQRVLADPLRLRAEIRASDL